MKKLLLALLSMCFLTTTINAQSLTNNGLNEPVMDPANPPYRLGDVMVKFADNFDPQFNGSEFKNSTVQNALADFTLVQVEKVFKHVKPIPPEKGNGFTTYNGLYVEYPKLDNIYKLQLKDTLAFLELDVIESLEDLGSGIVEFAELNYLFHTNSYSPTDPLYSQQWNKTKMKADSLQQVVNADTTADDGDIIIAILDTGVDTGHVDLKNKLVINQLELNGINGVDDDGNGFVDDVYGWDIINNDGVAHDDNSHGTHCAGIAAAEANNNLGIVGISEGAKILPVKVLQSNGWAGSDQIGQGIVYAANNGADILSMSFGGYGRSQIQENALAYAYAFSLPIAAAGNDGIKLGPCFMCYPSYPAAYSFVLGVQATKNFQNVNGWRADWTNIDTDGPIYSGYSDLLNYELHAPGEAIISTIPTGNYSAPLPNGRYQYFSGTSMSTPGVAGAIALYKALHPLESHEEIFVRAIRSWYSPYKYFGRQGGFPYPDMDVLDMHTSLPSPFPIITSVEVFDTIGISDGDGDADAGEIVDLMVYIKNFGTNTDSVETLLRFGEFEDTAVAVFIDDTATITSISPYAELALKYRVKIDPGVANNRDIVFNVKSFGVGYSDTISENFAVRIESGFEINAGYYTGTTVIPAGRVTRISGNIVCDTLIIEPGAEVYLDPGAVMAFQALTCTGTPDSMIVLKPNGFAHWGGFKYVGTDNNYTVKIAFTELHSVGVHAGQIYTESPRSIPRLHLEDCYITNSGDLQTGSRLTSVKGYSHVKRCVFVENKPLRTSLRATGNSVEVTDNIFVRNTSWSHAALSLSKGTSLTNVHNNIIMNNKSTMNSATRNGVSPMDVGWGHNMSTLEKLSPNYFGATQTSYVNTNIHDYFYNSGWPVIVATDSAMSAPTDQAHGFVVDVKIDSVSINAFDNHWDDSTGLGVIGLGEHKIELHFNRPMDTAADPFVTFGVRYPWTQNIVDVGNWSSDSLVWTGDMNITPFTASNGINRVSVRNARDNEGFECPIEDLRFELRINTLGALSKNLTAVGDTGKIFLNWSPPILIEDVLGYSLYRIDSTHIADTTLAPDFPADIILLDSSFVDTSVSGGKYYGYYVNTFRTDLSEAANSDTVWARSWQGKPSVVTKSVTNKTQNSVTLNGKANPNYLATEVRFNYGTTSNYSTNTSWQNIGNGDDFVNKSVNLSGLTPGTTYHYRIEAKNIEGTSYGKDSTFTTKDFPNLAYSYDSTLCVGDDVAFTNQSTISNGTLSYSWEIRNSSGTLVHSSTATSPTFTMSVSGTYTVKLTASSSDAVTTSKTTGLVVEAIPTPSITTSGATSFCQGGTVTLSGNTGYQAYSWSNGASTGSITVSLTDAYVLTVTSANGCEGSSSVNVNVNPLPVATVTSLSNNYDFCEGSSLSLEAPNGAAGYQWYDNGTAISGATASTFTATNSGNYSVQVTSTDGCTSLSSAQTVTENLNPTAAISNGSALSFCDGGSVILSAPSGMSYSWTTGATSQSITQSTSGQVGLTITDANGCSATATPVTINVYSVPSMIVTAASSTSICQGQSVTLQASGGFSSYAWSNGATNQNLITTTAGSYSVTGTTSDGCTATSVAQSVVVNANPTASITNSGTSVLCSGQSTTLSAPSGMSSYLWSDGSTTQSITASTAGNYTVTVTNSDGCSATSAATAITSSTITTPSITSSGSTTICSGSDVTLSVPTGYASYSWSDGSTTNSITTGTAGNYSVTVTNADGCSSTTSATAVTVNTPPSATITSTGTGSICAGASETLTATAGMTSYQWYANGTAITGATNATYTANAAGNYSVSVVDANGCSDISSNYGITNAAVPVATITNSGSSVLCAGDSTTLSAPSGMSSYLWSDGSTTQSITASTAGNYTVTVTNSDGCNATSAATSITSSTITTPSITSSGSTTICSGSDVTLSVPTGYASYSWSDGSTTNSITTGTAGNYSVTVTNADGCSTTTSAISVTVNTPPSATITSTGTGSICSGASETLTATAGMTSYQWYANGTAITGATNVTYTANSAGNYSVSMVDSNGCSDISSNYAITNAAAPLATITNSGSSVLCAGDSTTLSAPSGMSGYLWSTGDTTQNITALGVGNFTVTVTNANGCSTTSAATSITASQITAPTVTSNGSLEFCDGGSVSLAVPMGYSSFMWNNGSGFSQIVVSTSGDYYAQVMNSDGCSINSDTVTVTVFPTPPTPTISYTANDTLMTSSEAVGNQWYFNGNPMPGETNQTLRPLNLGNYSVRIIDTNGCEGDMSAMQFYNSIGMEENLADQIALYPNPTKGRVTLELNQLEVSSLRVVDATGRMVIYREGCTGVCELDLVNTRAGIYQIILITTEGEQIIKPIIVNR